MTKYTTYPYNAVLSRLVARNTLEQVRMAIQDRDASWSIEQAFAEVTSKLDNRLTPIQWVLARM